jgi:hypothetical protein
MPEFEEQYEDVLQNIEAAIVDVFRSQVETSDHDVMRALEVIIDDYRGENIGRPPHEVVLSEREHLLKDSVHSACEWRLGRATLPDGQSEEQVPPPEPKTRDEIILCLKRILKSAKFWNKDGGRQGYLNFIDQHV